MKIFAIVWAVFLLFVGGCWLANVGKLIACDWDVNGNFKGEVIHAVGVVVPPAAVITVWFNDK